MSILAIDYGKKRIGFAISSGIITTPLDTVLFYDKKSVFDKISEIIEEYAVTEMVVGMPVNMDDTESDATKEVRNFTREIDKAFGIKVSFVDERLTSKDAESRLALSEKNWRKRKKKIDGLAACLILENYLERKKLFCSTNVL
ncbi:MAG: Holliday junction resolvase RuvX [Elusimicrobia bacterium CG06_land_8_20_14_3_00_38_11]|nr:MAG: Holliday junction resolvase RuvX [Elusimicrobia bacterium CG06_land_8_20_14_3_00_38_11]